MPVRMLNFLQQRPPAPRFKRTSIKDVEEYRDAEMVLQAGLKPNEWVEVELSKESLDFLKVKGLKTNPAALLCRELKKKVKDLRLPYDVYVVGGKVNMVGRGALA